MSEAERITRALGGRWHGGYGVAKCPAHDDRAPSLSLSEKGGKLLLHCHSGCAFLDVLDALRGRGMVEDRGASSTYDPERIERERRAEEAKAEKRAARAFALWHAALPIHSTPAETYLRGRAITCALGGSLRFHPACPHPAGQTLPAMVAMVEGCDRFALHRTYLRSDGSGKADVMPAKAMLAATLGGAVRLLEAEGPLVVAEGIETALSLSSGLLRAPATIWAALSSSGIAGLRLPDEPSRLIVATDGDDVGRAASNRLAERAASLGWTVSLLPAPEGRDWNDVLTMKGAAA